MRWIEKLFKGMVKCRPRPAYSSIYGGWITVNWIGQRVRAVVRCQAPDMALYRENWETRKRKAM